MEPAEGGRLGGGGGGASSTTTASFFRWTSLSSFHFSADKLSKPFRLLRTFAAPAPPFGHATVARVGEGVAQGPLRVTPVLLSPGPERT